MLLRLRLKTSVINNRKKIPTFRPGNIFQTEVIYEGFMVLLFCALGLFNVGNLVNSDLMASAFIFSV